MAQADYFSEYSSFIGAKGLPSPADTPYETPGFLKLSTSSRATRTSREQSASPPPLPPDTIEYHDKPRHGRYSALDARRFTPTLHASLVSEILTLRRELESNKQVIENLETTLETSKNENEDLTTQFAASVKAVRTAKQRLEHVEKGTYEAVEDLLKERDAAKASNEDIRGKLQAAQRGVRRQEEDAVQNQSSWDREKQSWDNERRQLERRIHVTDNRLRAFVEEMSAQQAALADTRGSSQAALESGDEDNFKDSGLGNESDTASVQSHTSRRARKHTRNMSSLSFRSLRRAGSNAGNREGQLKSSLADELGIDEEDEYDLDDFEHDEDELRYDERTRRAMESRRLFMAGDAHAKAKRVLGLPMEGERWNSVNSPTFNMLPKQSVGEVTALPLVPQAALPEASARKKSVYVDTGVQPSPPSTPQIVPTEAAESLRIYSSASTQTEVHEEPPKPIAGLLSTPSHTRPPAPVLVPSIAIHPPTSRPSSPREAVLPPGTKSAGCQTDDSRVSGVDASVQTEEIRVDRRPIRLPPHLLQAPSLTTQPIGETGTAKIFSHAIVHAVPAAQPPPLQSPIDLAVPLYRDNSSKDLRSMPLRAIALPKPVLSPPLSQEKAALEENPLSSKTIEGPLNRSAQYGVSRPLQSTLLLADIDNDSDASDDDEPFSDVMPKDLVSSLPAMARPAGRYGLSAPPGSVPEDKVISPERRPGTSGSVRDSGEGVSRAAPAPSVASSIQRGDSQRSHRVPPPLKIAVYGQLRSRSPSFGSIISSTYSTQSVAPPFAIPARSSSRIMSKAQSEGSQSPTPLNGDVFGPRSYRGAASAHPPRKASLRKAQSAQMIRQSGRNSPHKTKRRRRLRSPDLTPVQSMAFESPVQTHFPIPELPTPIQQDLLKSNGSVDGHGQGSEPPDTSHSSVPENHEIGLVDAIAATMVGEWMWKYVRKRKSFGVAESTEDIPKAGNDGSVNITGNGVRHKRWVWLSPYERTIMWSHKQPTSGTALLGKNGRKLNIQSVLNVQDNTPMPKGADYGIYNRSILVLTPSRALKFTAINKERHIQWMTALSFLATSSQSQPPSRIPTATAPAPAPIPLPRVEYEHPKKLQGASLRHAFIRDSVQLAKANGTGKPKLTLTMPQQEVSAARMGADSGAIDLGADPPSIPRLYSGTTRHQRKRSNTSPRLPPALNNFRSFSINAVQTSASSNLHPGSSAAASSALRGLPSASSKSGSRRDSLTSPYRQNFFEAIGTVRMEAFVNPSLRDGVILIPPPPPDTMATRPRRRNSNFSAASMDKRRAGYVFDENGMDPFEGF